MSYTILGVHDGHCASAALMVDGRIVKAAQEERFVNIKNEPGMPLHAIRYCLKGIDTLNEVVLATKFIHEPEWYKKQDFWEKTRKDYYINKITWPFRKRLDPYFRNRTVDRKKLLCKVLKSEDFRWSPEKIRVLDHHVSHAAAAYYGSHYEPGEEVTGLTADGSGDGLSATVSIGDEGGILRRKFVSTRDDSIGEIYSLTTYYLGFRPWEHEYKLMGMAPYSKADPGITSKLFSLIETRPGRFKGMISADFAWSQLKQIYRLKRFDRICASIQRWFEHMMLSWISGVLSLSYPNKIACGGGDFMNVKTNQIIAQQPFIEDMFVFPSAGDESTSIGACMKVQADWCVEHGLHPKKMITPIGPLYLGPPAVTGFDIGKVCRERGWETWEEDDVAGYITDLLMEGEIVARCSGRLEFGARALGNRSILADASNMDVKTPLNAKVKHRDFWMPFAPSVLSKEKGRLYENPNNVRSPYMIMAFNSTEDGRRELAAAMHPWDFTLRPQEVEIEWNASYWEVLEKWRRASGNGGLLNTSFNVHGSPIVKDDATALWTLEQTGLENLVIDHRIIKK